MQKPAYRAGISLRKTLHELLLSIRLQFGNKVGCLMML